MKDKKRKKHEYSTIALLLFMFVLLVGGVVAIDASLFVPYSNANQTVDLNGQEFRNATLLQMKDTDTSLDILQHDFFGNGAYYIPLLIGNDSFGTPFTAFADQFILLDYGSVPNETRFILSNSDGSKQIQLIQDSSSNLFSLIVPTNYRTNIYGDVNVVKHLRIGNNAGTNLSNGDINATNIYYDTLVAKSPTFQCSQGSNWCKVTVPEYQKELYLQHDANYTILAVSFEGVEYTPQAFKDDVCKRNEKTLSACQKINKKLQKLSCERSGYEVMVNGVCLENPILKCDYTLNTSWDYKTDSCLFDATKECESQGNAWSAFTNTCTVVDNTPSNEQLKQECLKSKTTVWYSGACITLEEYYE